MNRNTYTLAGKKFECCGETMATVIMKGGAVCVMPELEYHRMIEAKWKFKKNKVRRSA